jgi:O-antigen/teichoic acid export membrane protein
MNLFHRDFMGTVRGVAFPAFARANREGDSVEARFSSSLTIIVAIAWPFYGFVAMFPLEILRLVFGPQWDAAAPLVPYFCIAGAFGATVSLIPTVMLAVGRPNLVALADLIVQPVKAVTLTAIVYQYRDLRMFVVVYMVISILAVPYFYAFKERCLPSDFRSIATSMARNGLLTATTLIPAIALQLVYLHPSEVASVPMFLTCSVLTVIAWTCTLWCMNHELFKEAKPILAAKFARKS